MWTLKDFVRESNRIEGIIRDPLGTEIEAHQRFLELKTITVNDLENFVAIIQPRAILRRKIGYDVRVGSYIAPPGGPEIEIQLRQLLESITKYNSYETHVAYEALHPFTDGNGRSGRVIWLRMMDGYASLGFLHTFYYQTLGASR